MYLTMHPLLGMIFTKHFGVKDVHDPSAIRKWKAHLSAIPFHYVVMREMYGINRMLCWP